MDKQRGFLLIELMIGLVIGILTSLAIAQIMAISEGQRRSTMSGEDAQVSGALALNALQRDIRQAGYGLGVNQSALGCPINGDKYNSKALPATLAPVIINDGVGSNGEDTLTIFASTKQGGSVPLLVTEDHLQTATDYAFVVKSTFSAATGDYLLAVPAAWVSGTNECVLFQATGIYNASGGACANGGSVACTKVGHAQGSLAYFPSAGYPAKSYLLNLGSSLRYRTYSISSNVLQITELSQSAKDAFPEIVNLQAFYAKDSDSDGVIDSYDTTTPTTVADWKKVLAIRVALVARSTQYEKESVTSSSPEWDLGTAISTTVSTTSCSSGSGGKCIALPVSHLADWQHYRYKVFETLIPLRNFLWNS
jgi:type IV pilus assembly protein PilW